MVSEVFFSICAVGEAGEVGFYFSKGLSNFKL